MSYVTGAVPKSRKGRYSLRSRHKHARLSAHNPQLPEADLVDLEEAAALPTPPDPRLSLVWDEMGAPPAHNRASTSNAANLADVSSESEELATYVQRLVVTSMSEKRAEDMRVLRGEIQRSEDTICQRMSELLERHHVAAPVPPTLSSRSAPAGIGSPVPQPTLRQVPARTPAPAPSPVPAPAPRLPPIYDHAHTDHLRDAHGQSVHVPRAPSYGIRQDPNSNTDDFLDRLQRMSLYDPLSASQPTPPPRRTTSKVFNFHKWGITFDNRNMTVDDFLFRLDRLRACYDASWEEVVMNFHQFISGQVESWFWVYLKTNPNVDWLTLRLALIEQFRSLESDAELYRIMTDRLQGHSESFDDFYAQIMQLNSRLRLPKSDMEIIELLKQNVKPRMGQLLLTHRTNSLPEMVHVCRTIEKYLATHEPHRQRLPFAPQPPRRQNVAELDPGDVVPPDFAAGHLDAFQQPRDTSKYRCWNCKQVGHSFFECTDPQRRLFCYRCGQEEVSTPNCQKCAGNPRRSNWTSRGNCSQQPTLDFQ